VLAACEPVYEKMPGWQEDVTGAKSLDDLPDHARHYLERISELTGVSLSIFSVGPDRSQTNLIRGVYA
jgi:adenylosuccinate synthase